MSRKSRTASYLALGRIWHDTMNESLSEIHFNLTASPCTMSYTNALSSITVPSV